MFRCLQHWLLFGDMMVARMISMGFAVCGGPLFMHHRKTVTADSEIGERKRKRRYDWSNFVWIIFSLLVVIAGDLLLHNIDKGDNISNGQRWLMMTKYPQNVQTTIIYGFFFLFLLSTLSSADASRGEEFVFTIHLRSSVNASADPTRWLAGMPMWTKPHILTLNIIMSLLEQDNIIIEKFT